MKVLIVKYFQIQSYLRTILKAFVVSETIYVQNCAWLRISTTFHIYVSYGTGKCHWKNCDRYGTRTMIWLTNFETLWLFLGKTETESDELLYNTGSTVDSFKPTVLT